LSRKSWLEIKQRKRQDSVAQQQEVAEGTLASEKNGHHQQEKRADSFEQLKRTEKDKPIKSEESVNGGDARSATATEGKGTDKKHYQEIKCEDTKKRKDRMDGDKGGKKKKKKKKPKNEGETESKGESASGKEERKKDNTKKKQKESESAVNEENKCEAKPDKKKEGQALVKEESAAKSSDKKEGKRRKKKKAA